MRILVIMLLLTACAPNSPLTAGEAKEVNSAQMLETLFMVSPPEEYMVVIEIHAHMNNLPHTETITQYVAGNNIRSRSVSEHDGSVNISESFFIDGEMFFCIKETGWSCENSEQAYEDQYDEQDHKPLRGDGTSADEREHSQISFSPVVNEVDQRTIAGLSTRCFEIKQVTNKEVLCMADNGIVAYRQLVFDEGEITEELRSFTATIPEDAFELPGPVGSVGE